MIDLDALKQEMEALEAQKANATDILARVEGAIQLCRHLIKKSETQAGEHVEGRNGLPALVREE